MKPQKPQLTADLVDKQLLTEAEIQSWLISYLAELLEMEPDEVDVTIPFDRYGVDSSAGVGLIGDLQRDFCLKLKPTTLYNYPTIEALTEYLAQLADIRE